MTKQDVEQTVSSSFPFTVFAFGTGESSDMEEKTIISHFSEACEDPKIVLEGPSLTGKEVGPNALLAFDKIMANLRQSQDQNQYVVNLTGLSRGAITCVRIANLLEAKTQELRESIDPDDQALLKKMDKLELNIFNLDPVTGMGGKKNMASRVIPANVKNYVAILQLDEMRRDFKPQDMTRAIIASPDKTHVSMIPLHGNHTDSIKIKDENMQSTAQIAQTALYSFLTKNGTKFINSKMPDLAISKKSGLLTAPEEINTTDQKTLFALFRAQHNERNEYLEYGKRHKKFDSAMFRKPRSMNEHREYYVADSHLFVNQLERELFKIAYPRTFNYFFEKNSDDSHFLSNSSTDDVIQELFELKNEHVELFEQLKERGVKEEESTITIGKPQGTPTLESCQMVMQIYPDLLPTSLTPEEVKLRSSVTDLKNEIISATFRYDRAKSQVLTFEERSQSNRTKKIREEVCKIVNDDEPNKETRLFDVLDKHASFLRNANSSSSLIGILETIRSNHELKPAKELSTDLTQEILASLIHTSLTLVKDTIYFVGSLGFVGGYGLSVIGTFLEDFGRRMNESIGAIGYNPLKLFAAGVATFVQAIGTVLKHHFGLKPLTDIVTAGIRDFRDESIASVRGCKAIKQELVDLKEGDSTHSKTECYTMVPDQDESTGNADNRTPGR